jgi:hypothetical protein
MAISRLEKQEGNAMLFAISLILVCLIILLALFDLCRIYIAREAAKTVSESIALAVSQELLYFRSENISVLAEDIALKGGCRLISLQTEYDEVEVSVDKEMKMTILGKLGLGSIRSACSISRVKVIYPWDRRWKNCRYYEFGYKPY